MKFQFEPDLDYQQEAIAAVCDLFRGQEVCRSEFTVAHGVDEALQFGLSSGLVETDLGVGNRLMLERDTIRDNLQEVQLRNGLLPDPLIQSFDFTVEMETGTGKTYVYLRTIFELNRLYGFTKFAIVVPSIAIKEGVNKSLEMMGSHFRALYAGVPFEHFVYDSTKLGQVRNFATSPHIQIMVMTVGAINRQDNNAVYQENEKTGGEKPIELIRATTPIVIVDEPQSVEGGLSGKGKQALEGMNPLCTLRYSATHAQKHHMVYWLNALDAYEQKLLKQIEVAAGTVVDDHNQPYIRLVSTQRKRGLITARVEVDIAPPGLGVRRQEVDVQDGDDLEEKTHRPLYHGHRIGAIGVGRGNQLVELLVPGGERWLTPDEAYGAPDPQAVHRQMIRKAIEEHLEKEKRLHSLGIKVLTLFFIDRVANYRKYEDGNQIKGNYAHIFEEEYRRAAGHPRYKDLFGGEDMADVAERAHGGYFSIDKAQRLSDTTEDRKADRDNAERAYNLIMKDKEKLLSLEEPLKFIFSHSALREGWDNPNVFQICTLRDIHTERERRQTIGRGLRLCVDQSGERQRGFEVNTLTVIAQESYEAFAENLQHEIEEETGIRFGVVEQHQFASIEVSGKGGQSAHLGVERSLNIWRHLYGQGYLDEQGNIAESLREALSGGYLSLPSEFEPWRDAITEALRKAAGRIAIRKAEERRQLQLHGEVLDSEEFKALWERIKHKTTYRVQFDNENLINECADALHDAPPIPHSRMRWDTAEIRIEQSGVQRKARESGAQIRLPNEDVELPDLLTELQNRTQLTRRSIRILAASKRLDDFKANPQKFIETAAEVINRRKRLALVDGIKYRRSASEEYYAQELFRTEELTGYLSRMVQSQKSVYDHVICDADNERTFASNLEKSSGVKVYAKLPRWFHVATPLGTYNPDWAVATETADGVQLYFVVETKGTSFADDLHLPERAKIECAKAHFEAIKEGESPAEYHVVHTFDELRDRITAADGSSVGGIDGGR